MIFKTVVIILLILIAQYACEAASQARATHKHLHEIGCALSAPDTCEWVRK